MSDPVRTIKKYPNRRLYDTANSGYITLADVKQMVLDNIDFQVVDAKSGDDLTRAILLQIILDEEGGGVPMFSSEMLAQMIRFYGSAQQTIMGQYMEQNVKAFLDDPEEAAGPGEAGLRRQDAADARPVEAVHADAGAGDAGHARQLPRAERQAVHGHAAADAGPDARHVHRVSVPQLRRAAANRRRRRQEALTRRSAAASRVVAARCCIALGARHRGSPRHYRQAPPRASARVPTHAAHRPARSKPRAPARAAVGFVSLGCPKALVDSEQILTQLRAEGYAIAPSYDGADLVVVNTCGFIDAAVAESLDAIGEALAENGKVIVTGCLGAKDGGGVRARRASEGARRHRPARDAGSDDAPCTRTCRSRTIRSSTSCRRRASSSRRRTTRTSRSAKAATTAARSASFPSMRGDLVQRPIGEVMQEAENLVEGRREGTARHLAGHERLRRRRQVPHRLLAGPPGEDADDRARAGAGRARACGCACTTSIPIRTSTTSIPLMADGKLLPYLDVPFQHASPRILKLMKRPANAENTLRAHPARGARSARTSRSARRSSPAFPARPKREFDELLGVPRGSAARPRRLLRLFAGRRRRGQRAARSGARGRARGAARALHGKCRRGSAPRGSQRKVGATIDVLVDAVDGDDGDRALRGRRAGDRRRRPDRRRQDLEPGAFARVTITAADEHDLHARIAGIG